MIRACSLPILVGSGKIILTSPHTLFHSLIGGEYLIFLTFKEFSYEI
jgi:hypothetical protein